jgi:hypothetical protein
MPPHMDKKHTHANVMMLSALKLKGLGSMAHPLKVEVSAYSKD